MPRIFLSEQVVGFSKPFKKGTEYSAKDEFLHQVLSIVDGNGEKHFTGGAAIKIDSDIFVEGSRPRCLV